MEFRLRDFWYPVSIVRMRRLLDESQWWPPERLRAFQEGRLQAVVHQAARIPYWRDLFNTRGLSLSDVRTASDLTKLPVLDKDTVRAEMPRMSAPSLQRLGARLSRTSGSTGTALSFYLDKATNVLEFATLWRQFSWHGYRFGARFADLRGRTIERASGIERDRRLNSLNISSFQLTRERARAYADALARFRPCMLRGYPSSLSILAGWLLEDRDERVRPQVVICSSETLLDHQAQRIASAFAAPVRDYYGQMERVAFIGQCARGRYHVASEYGIVEVLDADGAPVSDGTGRLVATSLWNMAMPLLRYDTRDLVTVEPGDSCDCGRTLPVVLRVVGRIEDIVVTPDGRHVGRLDAAFKYSEGIRLAQIVQEDPAAIDVRLVRGPGFSDAGQKRLVDELRLRLGEAIRIDVRYVEEIERTEGGKHKFVVSRLPPKLQEGRSGALD